MTSELPSKSTGAQRLSVPPRHTRPPRALSDDELNTLLRIADTLIPASGPNPKASDAEGYQSYLDMALAARADAFEAVLSAVHKLTEVPEDGMWAALKEMWSHDKVTFDPLSSVVAGAYFMTPQIKKLIGYPGQHRDPAPLEEAADEIASGILDPVIARGYIYVSAARPDV